MLKRHGNKLKYILTITSTLLAVIILLNYSTTVLRAAYPLKYDEYVYKYSRQYKVDPYLVFSIIKAESSFNPQATSSKKARGLMQITEKTGNWGAKTLKIEDFSIEKLYEPEINIKIGCWYINTLMKEFGNDIDLVVAAYNGGSGNVAEWLRDRNYSSSGTSLDKIPFKETDRYLKRVKNNYYVYKKIYSSDL